MNPEWQNLRDEIREIWNSKAAFWDEMMGDEGNSFHNALVEPSILELLAPQHGETILDIACGSGLLARRLAQSGTHVVAVDLAETFIHRAKERINHTMPELADSISFRVMDATDQTQLLTLGEGRFHGAVCSMALMDMADIDPLLATLPKLLTPNGRFVFVVPHPCFNNNGFTKVLEEEDRDGVVVHILSIKVNSYLPESIRKGVGAFGEPAPHYYFHRPLHVLLGACFRAGLIMDGILEPAFPPEALGHHAISWDNYHEIPPILAVRMRVAPQ